MPRYDYKKKAYIPGGIPDMPIGTLDELQSFNLSASTYHSCHEPTVDGTIAGCPLWHVCTMSYKGKHSKDGGGPRNHCWERIKSAAQGGAIVRNTQPCYCGIAEQESVFENKAVLRPICGEGEEYETLVSMMKPTGPGQFVQEQLLVKQTVTPFKRPGESKTIAQARLRAEITQRERERLVHERTAEHLGVSGGSTPIDKRVGRGSKGGAKEAGSQPNP